MKLHTCLLALLTASLLLLGCRGPGGTASPILLSVAVRGESGAPIAFVRSNLRQTVAYATAEMDADLLTAEGIPIYLHAVQAGRILWIDRDADQRLELRVGDPLPPAAAVLFPGPLDAELFGVRFEAPPP